MKNHDEDEARSRALDDMIDAAEEVLRRGIPSTTSQLLVDLDALQSCVARMEATVRAAREDVVTSDDSKALKKAFRCIRREAEMLLNWLRFTRLEQHRN
jgi:hypothetical protein